MANSGVSFSIQGGNFPHCFDNSVHLPKDICLVSYLRGTVIQSNHPTSLLGFYDTSLPQVILVRFHWQ